MAQRHQRGWLKKERRKDGETWMLFFRTTRESDGKRVEQKISVGTVHDFPTKASAWAEVERQQIHINKPDFRKRITFADLAQHYQEHELGERRSAIVDPKAHTTIAGYKRVLRNRLLPRWGKRFALSIQPLEVEEWLSAVKEDHKLENPTLDKMRRVMSLVYKHGQRYGLIPRREESNPLRFVRCKTISSYEAVILTPEQAFAVLVDLPEPERTLTLLAAQYGPTHLRMLGLAMAGRELRQIAHPCAAYLDLWQGRIAQEQGVTSSGAAASAAGRIHAARGKTRRPTHSLRDWVFPSLRLHGKKAAGSQHAGGRPSAASSGQSGSARGRRSMPLRVPQSAAFAGVVSGSLQDRSEDGAGALAAFGREDDAATLRTQRQRGPHGGPRASAASHPWQ